MNITPEEKKVGIANFRAAMASKLMRRDFFRSYIEKGLSSGHGLGAEYFGYSKIDKPLRVGVLGTGDEGNVLLGGCTPDYIEVVAIADIRSYNIWRAFNGDVTGSPKAQKVRPGLCKVYGWGTEEEARKHVKVYADYRDLLADSETLGLEAVLIALPLHLHQPAAMAAMEKGLHVLTEKLMAHDIGQCKDMGRLAVVKKRHMATGHQRHYSALYDNAIQAIQQGLLGDLHYIRAQWHRGNLPGNDSWQPMLPLVALQAKNGKFTENDQDLIDKHQKKIDSWRKRRDDAIAKKAPDADSWVKKVAQLEAQLNDEIVPEIFAKCGYEAHILKNPDGSISYEAPALEELIRWRLWNRTSAGLMAELGSHQLDASSIFISAMHGGEKQIPLTVNAFANRPVFPYDRDIEDHISCIYEYPAPGYDPNTQQGCRQKIAVAYSAINGNDYGGYGETVFGTKGTLQLEREETALLWYTHNVGSAISVLKDEKSVNFPLTIKTAGDVDEADLAYGIQALRDLSLGYTEEIEHFAWCVRNNPEPNYIDKEAPMVRCQPKVAMADAVIALTTNIAAAEGRKIDFKKEWFDVFSDETPDGSKPAVAVPEGFGPNGVVPAPAAPAPAPDPTPAPAPTPEPAPAPAAVEVAPTEAAPSA
ncbi:MAG: Gfo/Idh/MocA family oxidoreductase [Planctomycetia bacterium]|nr:Gfo/Idh/MocA family oxidoreductase [Planctomycetia bacterium]